MKKHKGTQVSPEERNWRICKCGWVRWHPIDQELFWSVLWEAFFGLLINDFCVFITLSDKKVDKSKRGRGWSIMIKERLLMIRESRLCWHLILGVGYVGRSEQLADYFWTILFLLLLYTICLCRLLQASLSSWQQIIYNQVPALHAAQWWSWEQIL